MPEGSKSVPGASLEGAPDQSPHFCRFIDKIGAQFLKIGLGRFSKMTKSPAWRPLDRQLPLLLTKPGGCRNLILRLEPRGNEVQPFWPNLAKNDP